MFNISSGPLFTVLEGPQKELELTYNKILSDKRHTDIQKLSENSTKRRLFTNWAMRGDPLMTSMWTNKDIKDGKVKVKFK